ncbi:MAG: tetratricopeptide repeat protein [Candidatus Acidiferrales bacterium]
MAFNKSKLAEAAQKYLQQGKVPQAIAEYQQILKHEPKDQVILMTVGDLFVRQGETFQAIEYFERLAHIFLNDGFTTKAIAIYKKVAKLAPEESRPLERLAELYVQQGVLSEARPLYLQLAEVHLKAGRQTQAISLLKKLLEAEPENLRVQLRLAELYIAMGQTGEALHAYRDGAQKLVERGDHAEALRLADRALELERGHPETVELKARILIALQKRNEALKLLESLSNAAASGPIADLLVAQYIEGREFAPAIKLATSILASDPKNYALGHKVAVALLEAGELDAGLALLGEIRIPMTDGGDHEHLEESLRRAAELMPARLEPLEWLVDFFGRTSDSFRLPDALAQLAQAAERAGDTDRARQVYEQLIDRNPEDESVRRRYSNLLARLGMKPAADLTPPVKVAPPEPDFAPPSPSAEPPLDDDTQRFVAQALTDVDLFSSYGLAHKAIELLEEVRLRAPGHSPILERLLDLHLGAGDERRTAELAAQLEQLWNTRGDRARAERFAELRQRFQRAAGLDMQDIAAANAKQAEDAVPVVEAEPVPENAPQPEFEVPAVPTEPAVPMEPAAPEVPTAQAAAHEVDLSEEWASLSQQLEEAAESPSEPAAEAAPVAETPTQQAEPQPIEAAPPVPAEPTREEYPAFDLELEAPGPAKEGDAAVSADQLLAELAADLDAMVHLVPKEANLEIPARTQAPPAPSVEAIEAPAAQDSTIETPAEPAPKTPASPAATGDIAGPLGDVFEEFRAELGEMGAEDEDLETHYNLGVAYREMGLLEEAISEFQKVAKANEKGQPFRYAMQCCTLLGLLFMEKGQPAIAAMWYERALRVPGLDQDAVLALRYDLGVAQELAGDAAAALKSFLQVYASNIDYRDVADRITALERAR